MAQRRVFVQKVLVVAVMGCVGTILAAGQHKEQSTASTLQPKKMAALRLMPMRRNG